MRGHDGFALIAVLWVTAALGVLTTWGLAEVEVHRVATENRILQRQAYWAARGCLAVLRARIDGPELEAVSPVELAPGVVCEAWWEDPHERLNPNHVDSVSLARLFGDRVATPSLLDWMDSDETPREGGAEADWYRARGRMVPRNGPLMSTRELLLVRGFEDGSQAWVDEVITVAGDGRIDPNRAPPEVLGSLPMVSPQQGARIAALRVRRRLDDAEEVMNAAGARLDVDEFRALAARMVFDPQNHLAKVVGQASRGSRRLQITIAAEILVDGERARVREVRVRP